MSYNTYTRANGDGSTTQFSTGFDAQILDTDVKVYLLDSNGVYQPRDSSEYQVSGNTVTFNTAPPSGTNNVLITRETDIDERKVPQFNPGSSIRGQDLDSNFKQLLYSAQETSDKSIDKTRPEFLASLDMNAKKITNLGEATDDDDAVTRKQLGDLIVEDMTGDTTTGLVFTKSTGGTNSGDQVSVAINRLTLAEQNANPNDAGTDDKLASMAALTKRFDVIYQAGTPSGTDWPNGKLWYDHGNDQTLSVWSTANQNWLGVVSGGTFITQPTVIWVDQANGLDTNDGHRIIDAMKTIKAAVASADHGDIILVAPGVYREVAPIDITVNNLSIVGQSLRSVFVHPTPATEENTLFRVNSGTYISGFTFAGIKASGARGGHAHDNDSTYGLPANQGWVAEFYPNAVIYKSPYIQNCTNFSDSGISNATQAENSSNYFDPNNVSQGGFGGDLTSGPTGGGIFIDGFAVASNSPLRSMVVDAFTQVNLDGPGLLATNNGYAQLVSFFGTFCHYHAKALNGAQLNLSNCVTDYGRYGLIADGKSPTPNFTASVSANAASGATTFTIGSPTAGSDWYGSATRPQDNMLVTIGSNTYPISSAVANGSGWDVSIENPDPNANATNLGLSAGISSGDTASFYNRSYISTSGHTFEYVGAGTDYRAAPENGGVAVEANQVANLNGGKVWQSSMDHNGKFKVGDTFTINQRTGQVDISLDAYRPEVVNDLTPQLGGDLDVNGKDITGTVKLNGITYPSSDGSQNHVMTTDGSGNLSFQSIGTLQGSGLNNVADDTTPQLGGNLDLDSHDITGTGDITITGNVTATSFVKSGGTSSQFLKADGSVDTNTYLTSGSYTETDPVVAAINGIVKSNGTTISAATAGTDYLTDVSQDSSPQLGGNLDVNGNDIVTTSNGDIDLDPNGSGVVVFKGNATKGSGQFKLNCENNSHGVTIKGPAHSAAANYTLTLPTTDGNANEYLQTDGSGNLTWAAASGGGGSSDIPSGVTMLFYETAAPSGWTKVTTIDQHALRVVSGSGASTGGSINFTTVFDNWTHTISNISLSGSMTTETVSGNITGTVGNHAISLSEMRAHAHDYTKMQNSSAAQRHGGPNNALFYYNEGTTTQSTQVIGGSTGHNHSAGNLNFSDSGGHSHSLSGVSGSGSTGQNLSIKYADVILCTKN